MPRPQVKQGLAMVLALLMVQPYPLQAAAEAPSASAAVLGSLSSYGPVQVGEIAAPAETTLFDGDLVSTLAGRAVVQYQTGARVVVDPNSAAQFSAGQVQLQRGQMDFLSSAENAPVFLASTLRLEPVQPGSSASVSLNEGKASVAVIKGAIRVVDPTGARLRSLEAGQSALFAMASAAAPALPSASPAQFAPGTTLWVLLAAGAAAGAATAVLLLKGSEADLPPLSVSRP